MTHILGLNAYHGDSSACLVRDGVLVAAAEEERFRRIKHWAGFPTEAIRYCLAEAQIGIGDLDIVAINQDAGANLWKKIAYTATKRPDLSLVLDRIRNKRERAGVAEELARAFPGALPDQRLRAEVRHIEHHLAHLGSAFLVSPFEDAVAVSVDGFGDFASAAWGVGRGNRIEVEDKVYFPHSLGIFYQALTQYLGFPNYGDEYKLMGLAPYGDACVPCRDAPDRLAGRQWCVPPEPRLLSPPSRESRIRMGQRRAGGGQSVRAGTGRPARACARQG